MADSTSSTFDSSTSNNSSSLSVRDLALAGKTCREAHLFSPNAPTLEINDKLHRSDQKITDSFNSRPS